MGHTTQQRSLSIRKHIVALVAGALVGATGTVAQAIPAYAGWASMGSFDGVVFEGNAWVDIAPATPAGGGQVRKSASSPSIPAYWAGVAPKLYRNGAVCASKVVSFNSAPVSMVSNSLAANCGSGTYRSQNTLKRYKGSATYQDYIRNSPNDIKP
jgi:hypothetical protein